MTNVRGAADGTDPIAGELRPVQRKIRDAAVELFARQGFDGTSVQEIVDAAGLTKGALYHYYSSKSDLLDEIYHALIRRQLAGLDAVLARGLGPAETIRLLLHDLIETTARFTRESRIFRREMHKLSAAHLASIAADRRRYHQTFRDLVADAQRAGVFNSEVSADTATYTVFGMINELSTWYRQDGPTSPGTLADELADFTLAALRP